LTQLDMRRIIGLEQSMERELIGKGYYAIDADAAVPSTAPDLITTAFREAFEIPSNEIRVVRGEAAKTRQFAFDPIETSRTI
jgi:hypothetical protein